MEQNTRQVQFLVYEALRIGHEACRFVAREPGSQVIKVIDSNDITDCHLYQEIFSNPIDDGEDYFAELKREITNAVNHLK